MDVDPPDINESPLIVLLFFTFSPPAPYIVTQFARLFTLAPKTLTRGLAFILSGGASSAAEVAKEIARQKAIDELQKKVWGYNPELETHTVETHIYRLRKKIKDAFNDDEFILNEKDGYCIR